MTVILKEKGRGKFKPAPCYEINEVKELLNSKIEEERQAFAECSEEIEFDKLRYNSDKWNLLSLFSGCGGLDLGFELAGLKAVMGEEVMEAAFNDKKIFDKFIMKIFEQCINCWSVYICIASIINQNLWSFDFIFFCFCIH